MGITVRKLQTRRVLPRFPSGKLVDSTVDFNLVLTGASERAVSANAD